MNHFSVARIVLILTSLLLGFGTVQAAEYPAAYFQPYIVYQAPEIAEQAAQVEAESAAVAEPESVGTPVVAAEETLAEEESSAEDPYPAAYFQPEIVYQDQEQIAALTKQQVKNEIVEEVEEKSAQAAAFTPAAPVVITDEGGFPMSVLLLMVAVIGAVSWAILKTKPATVVAAGVGPIVVPEEVAPEEAAETSVEEPSETNS